MTDLETDYTSAPTIEWEDPDEHDGEWPYPTSYVRRTIEGPLADAVRKRLGVDSAAPVEITEAVISGGYSEWTQENEYEMTISCAGVEKEFDTYTAENNLVALLRWLDETPADAGR